MREAALRQCKDSCQEAECLCADESEVCPASPVSLQGETGKWFEGDHHLHILLWFSVVALAKATAPSPRKGGFLKDSIAGLNQAEGTEGAGGCLQDGSRGSVRFISVLVQVLDLLCGPLHCLVIPPGLVSKPLLY